jgi:hypothetical protein
MSRRGFRSERMDVLCINTTWQTRGDIFISCKYQEPKLGLLIRSLFIREVSMILDSTVIPLSGYHGLLLVA